MTRKFTMELVWHNCYLYPPREERNNKLYVTDGVEIFKASYDIEHGWSVEFFDTKAILTLNGMRKFWWADINQTLQADSRFIE